MDGAVRQKSLDASGEAGEHAAQPVERVLTGAFRCQVAWSRCQCAFDRIVHDEPAVDHVRQTVAQPRFAQLGV
jgi:hypothetical protein